MKIYWIIQQNNPDFGTVYFPGSGTIQYPSWTEHYECAYRFKTKFDAHFFFGRLQNKYPKVNLIKVTSEMKEVTA